MQINKRKKEDIISKENFIVIVLSVVQLIISLFTDLQIRTINIITIDSVGNIIKYIIWKTISFILYISIWKGILYVVKKIRQKDQWFNDFVKIFICFFSINIILLILTWPGIWRFDEFKILVMVRRYEVEYWQHYITSIFYSLALCIIPIPCGIVLCQITVISTIISYILTNFKKLLKNSKYILLLCIPFLLLPLLDTNLYPIRLSIYTYIELLMVCQLIFMWNKEKITKLDIGIIAASLITLSVWRSEGVLLIILIPIICMMVLKNRIPRISKRILISLITIISAIVLIIPQEVSYKIETSNHYELTSFINQLYILAKKDIENGKMDDETKEKINKVLDLDSFIQYDNGILANNNGLMYRKNYTQQDYKELKKVYYKLLLKYPIDVLKERVALFAKTSGLVNNVNVHVENTRTIYDDKPKTYSMNHFTTYYESNKPLSIDIRNATINILEGWQLDGSGKTTIVFNIFYNIIPSIIIIIAACIYTLIKKKWISFSVFSIILLKAIAIFLTAPDTFFMYYLPIYLVGYFMLALAVVKKLGKNENLKIFM